MSTQSNIVTAGGARPGRQQAGTQVADGQQRLKASGVCCCRPTLLFAPRTAQCNTTDLVAQD